MADRKKVGILFGYSEHWIGGSYYFINLILAFKRLEDELMPHVFVITDDANSYKKIQETGYKYLSQLSDRFKYNFIEKVINKLGRVLLGKSLVTKGFDDNQLSVIFGYYEQLHTYKCARKLYWIPDLQDKHYPEYLGIDIAKSRTRQHKALAYSKSEIVFSSKDSEEDFKHFYPSSTCKTYVVPFAVTLPSLVNMNADTVLNRFNLPKHYFIIPNQFWSHKNHLTVIKAIELLKNNNIEVIAVFTGNENTGGGKYANELKEYVEQNRLTNNIRFLGFIDRKQQLVLMRESVAVIQPSLFEGWSTVIEDAKALNKFIIASNIPVHSEQLTEDQAVFFDPLNFKDLSLVISKQISEKKFVGINYDANIIQYANCFLEVINKVA